MELEIDLFDIGSIERAKRAIQETKERLKEFQKVFLAEVAAKGVEFVQEELASVGLGDSELAGTVMMTVDPSGQAAYVRVTAPYGIYVEYGTGIKGMGAPHPELPAEWVYNSGRYSSVYGYWFFLGKDNNWHKTYGQSAKAFFYRASKRLEDYVRGLSE